MQITVCNICTVEDMYTCYTFMRQNYIITFTQLMLKLLYEHPILYFLSHVKPKDLFHIYT